MGKRRAISGYLQFIAYFITICAATAQCPQFPSFSISGNATPLCEGETVTLSISGLNIPPGSSVEWYIGDGGTYNPYNGEGMLIGSVLVEPGDVFDDFIWTVPADWCETQGDGDYWIVGILNPPPAGACIDIFTEYWGLTISCPEINLSGGGEVCEGNCPDAPTELIFTIEGNDTPFEADLVLTASLFPPFAINDLEIANGQSIFVCLDGFVPGFDPATGILTVPVFAIGITAAVTISNATSASGCPVLINQNSISLSFIAAPTADAGDDQTICASEDVILSGEIGGSAGEAEWDTDGDGTFADPNDLNTTYTPGPSDIANGEVEITLMATDDNGTCIPAESIMTITIEPSLLIEVSTPLTICDNDVAMIFAMVTGSNEPCNWETTGDGDFDDPQEPNTIYTPGPNDINNGSVTLTFVPIDPDACLENSEPLELTIVAAPDVDIPQNLEICEGDSVEITINIQGDYGSVTWSAPGDGDLVVDDESQVTYTPGPMDINAQFFIVSVVIQSTFPECGQITYNIPVDIILCDCPPLETNPPAGALCAVNDMLDLSTLLVDGDAGTWSVTNEPPGSNPATITGNLFSTNMSDPGMYTVTYTLQNPEPGCPVTSSEDIAVNGIFSPLSGPDQAFCGPQSVVLNGIVTPSAGIPVLWSTTGDGIFSDPSSLNTTYIPGTLDSAAAGLYLILEVLDPLCGNQSDTMTLFFNAAPFAQFVNDTVTICNSAANGSVLNFNSLVIAGDANGVWTNTSGLPIDFSNPSSVNFDGMPEGYYPFEYQTNSAVSPCAETTYIIIISVEDCLCPLLMSQNVPSGVCNDLGMLALNAFISAGGPGTWQIFSSPPGSNPATLSGPNLIINGCDQGTYGLRFTLDAAPLPACPDSVEISIFIQAEPILDITGDTSGCGQTPLNLNAFIGGSASGILWTTTGLGTFDDPSSLTPVYTPATTDVASAQVNLIATAIDPFGFCPVPADTIHVFLVTPPSTTFSALTAILCNNPDSGSVINLFSYIVGGDGTGFWTDADGAGVNLSDPTNVDFDGVSPGNYRLIYTTQTALAPCTDSMYTFLVVIEDCTCPPISILTSGIMMCQNATSDLNAQIINAAPGNWLVTQGPSGAPWPQINGNSLSTVGAGGGSYTLTYTLIDSVPGCQASASIPLFVELTPLANIVDIACDATQTTYEILVETTGASLTADFGDVTTAGTGQFLIANVLVGQDIVILVSSASGLCSNTYNVPSPDCSCTLFTEDIADTLTLCPGDTFVLIPFVTGAQGLPFSTWVTPYGTKMQPTLPLHQEGKYIWIVIDSAGCEERDTFNAVFIGPESAVVTSNPPSCPGNLDGQLLIQSISEGSPPYSGQLDNGSQFLITQFPYVIDQVGLGDHVLTITDIIGCSLDIDVTVIDQDGGMVSLGPDVVMQKGDSVLISPTTTNIEVAAVTWDPSFPGNGIEPFWYGPDSTVLVTVMVTDTAGCTYQDQMLITVIEKALFYVPNVFSPNGDQINDVLEIYTNLPAERLTSLEIFDRWGGMVYAQYQTLPITWDGTSKSKLVQSGVYVYKLIWKDERDHPQATAGTITILK